jgi:flagellar hook-associated protein 3 FlgL
MRVVQKTIFDLASYQLDNLTEALQKANQVVTTGKRINQISDDPVGMSRTMGLQSSLDQLTQLGRNISTARTWLDAGETAAGDIENMLVNTKTLAIQMENGTMTATDRANAAVQVQETISEIYGIANSKVNGMYLFAGTKGDVRPIEFDNQDTPTQAFYNGNQTGFAIKSGENTTMTVGFSGEDVFGSQTLTIDSTNQNLDFKEDGGSELTAVIPEGTYTKTDLAKAVEVAMEAASAASGNSIDYTVSYDKSNGDFTVQSGNSFNPPNAPLSTLDLLWHSGSNADASIGTDMGFDTTTDGNGTTETGDPIQWGLFKTLFDLRDALKSNDSTGIAKSMSKLDDYANQMTDITSQIGYKGVALDSKESIISDLNLSDKTQKSALEDADIMSAITDLQAKQLAYQAALSSSSKIMKLSLVDYL